MRRAHITWFCLPHFVTDSFSALEGPIILVFKKSPAILWWVLFSYRARRSLELQVYGGYMTCFKSLNCLLGWTDNTARCKCEQSWNEIRLLRSHLKNKLLLTVKVKKKRTANSSKHGADDAVKTIWLHSLRKRNLLFVRRWLYKAQKPSKKH